MLTTVKKVATRIWQVVAWLIILFAVLLAGLRLTLPGIDLEPYHQEIERVVEQKAELPLRLGAIQAQIKGIHLVFRFSDVTALHEETGEALLYAPEVFVEVQLLKSLLAGRLLLGNGKVVGTKLKMERFSDGTIALQGMERNSNADPSDVMAIFLGQNRLSMINTQIDIKSADPGRPPLKLSGLDVDLLNDGLHHQVAISSRVGSDANERIHLIADLRQESPDSLEMSGKYYFKCEDLQLGSPLNEWLPAGYQLDSGEANLELWGELRQGLVQNITGHTEFRGLEVSGQSDHPPFSLQNLSTQFDISRNETGWALQLDQFVLSQKHRTWRPGALEIAWWQTSEQDSGLHLMADYLSLETIHDFFSTVEFPIIDLRNALLGLSPKGDLTGLDFTLRKSSKAPLEWDLKGEIRGFSTTPWKSIPGTEGVNMSFDGSQSGGWLRIDSDNLTIEYPQLFRRSLKADCAVGEFLWNFDLESGLHMQTDYLEMSNPDMETLSRIELQIPITGQDLFVDIQTDFWNADGSRKSDYLPVTVMPEPLVKWLDKSLVSGNIKSGSFLLYGPANKFPFKAQEGRFEVWLGIEDLLLDYMPGWPELSNAQAEIHFINNGLKAQLHHGEMLNSRLQDVSINIDELRNPTPVEIKGEAKGPVQDILTILGDTPLKQDFRPFVDAVSVGGESRTVVDLAIPLKNGRGALSVNGEINFENSALTVKQGEIDLKGLTGKLKFDDSGARGKGLKARFLDEIVRFDVAPYRHQNRDWTHIKGYTTLNLERMQKKFPDWYLEYFKGSADTEMEFSIAHQPSHVPVRINLKSDLKGVAVDLPEPLGKGAETTRSLDMGVDILNDLSTEIRIRYDQDTHALLRFYNEHEKPWVAAIGFNQQPLSLDGIDGFHLSGQLESLNADQWISWANHLPASEYGRVTRIEMDLRVDELKVLGTACPQTHFSYKNYANGYRVNLTSDTVQGTLQVPGNLMQQPILGRFDYIKLNLEELASAITGEQTNEKPAVKLDPRNVPAVNLSVDGLFINDRLVGKGNLTWSKENNGITIDNLTLVGKNIDLYGQGYWRLTSKGDSTGLNLQMKTPSLGDLQNNLGLTTGIEKAATEVKAELYWPTSPLEMGAEHLFGSIWLNVDKGEVSNVDPGVGRLIGLFSLNALGKRLALDFSDLFSKGMAFDNIQGNFILNDGDAYTADLVMRSTAAVVDIRGRTGLSSRTYDQRVVVTPNVSATLPLVGALAINPTVGVALAVTQQLFGKHFDRIAMRTYEVTGSWDNPQFSQLYPEAVPPEKDPHMPEMPGE